VFQGRKPAFDLRQTSNENIVSIVAEKNKQWLWQRRTPLLNARLSCDGS